MRSAPAFVRLWPKFARSPICCSDGHSVCCTTAAGAVAAGAATVVAPAVVVAGGGAASVVAGCVTVNETVVLGCSFVVAGVGAACVSWVSACFDDPQLAPASTTTSAPRAIERRTRARLLVRADGRATSASNQLSWFKTLYDRSTNRKECRKLRQRRVDNRPRGLLLVQKRLALCPTSGRGSKGESMLDGENKGASLRDYLRVVRRRKWVIAQALILVPAAAVAF